MIVLSTLFSCVNSEVKLFVFAMNSMGRYSIFVCFIYGLEEKNSKSEVIFAVMPFAVNVMLNLSIDKIRDWPVFKPNWLTPLPFVSFTGRTYSMEGNIFFFTIMGYYSSPLYTNLGSVHHDIRAAYVFQPEITSGP